jgi:nucleoside-diphosphate-sugar epimerase
MAAEAIVKDTLRPVCAGAAVVYHCIHPTRDYGLLVPITRHIVEIVEETGALLVMAGNMWPYGPVDRPISEESPYRRTGTNGRVYIETSEIVAKAAATGRIQAIIGRVAHCYGPFIRRQWPGTDFIAALLAKPNQVVGDPDAKHSFIFVDDFAHGLIRLASAADATGKVWHIPGPEPVTIREFLSLMYTDLRLEPRIKKIHPASLLLKSIFSQEADRLREMRYQFEKPFIVDSHRFEAVFDGRVTPHAEGIRRTLDWHIRLEEQA